MIELLVSATLPTGVAILVHQLMRLFGRVTSGPNGKARSEQLDSLMPWWATVSLYIGAFFVFLAMNARWTPAVWEYILAYILFIPVWALSAVAIIWATEPETLEALDELMEKGENNETS